MRINDGRLLFVVFLLAFMPPSVMAQTSSTGALAGTVTDPTGAVVPNVTVTATSLNTGQVRTAVSGGDGSYKVALLPPGNYRVKFDAPGFQATEAPSVTVTVTETGTLNEALAVGAQTQEVTVQADVETVQTANATLGTVVGTKSVTDLPLNTRNYTNLLSLSAGTSASVQNASAIGKGSQATSVNGGSALQNNYQMDGVSIVNGNSQSAAAESGTEMFIGIPNPDSIQEFKIQTSLYDAGYGRNPGANVNVVTKAGTNQFHGTAFEFLRNTVFNANDWFLNHAGKPRGVLNQNQFGGVFGGPVKKDKLFFFLSYQETEQKNGIASGGLSNPILPVIPTGSRGSTAIESASTPWLSALYADYCGKAGASGGVQIRAPQFGPTAGSCSNTGYNSAIAVAPINPVAANILQLQLPNSQYYVPAGSGGTLPLSVPAIYHEHQGMANWDYVIDSKNTLSGRYFYSLDPTDLPFGNGATSLPGFPTTSQWTDEEAVLKLTSILSNNLVNEARMSYQRYISNVTEPSLFTDPQVGITPLTTQYPGLTSITPGTFTIGEYTFGLVYIVMDQYQWADQLSWTHGKHTIRTGAEVEDYRRNWSFPSLETGSFNFSSFPDFLIGLPGCSPSTVGCSATNPGGTPGNPATNGTAVSNVAATGNSSAVKGIPNALHDHTPFWDLNAFVQDDFKINRRLTLNLGLRWEYDAELSENSGKLTNIQTNLMQLVPYPVVATACTGIIFPAPCAGGTYLGYAVPKNYNFSLLGPLPSGVFQSNHNIAAQNNPPLDNFGPRLGFAWQPLASSRLVVRGGAGYFYDRLPAEDYHTPSARQSPYAVNEVASGTATYFSSDTMPFSSTPVGWLPRWVTLSGLSSGITAPEVKVNLVTPLTYQYNLNVQYEFLPTWVLEMGYVGSRGIHQWATAGVFNPPQLASAANPVNCGYDGVATDCITTDTTSNVNLRVPYYGIAPTDTFVGSTEDFKFNSLQTTVRKQFSHGLTFQGAYTWSRALLTTYVGVNSDFPISHEYGLNSAYHPQRLAMSYNWDLPFGHPDGLKGRLVNGWNLSGVTTIQDGTPLTITDSRGGTAISAGTSTAEFATGMGNTNIGSGGGLGSRVLNGYFNTSAFTLPPCVTAAGAVIPNPGSCPAGDGTAFGNSGLGVILGPPQDNWDISLAKLTKVGGLREDATLTFRAEFFNAFNHPQFSNPAVAVSTASSFGKITSLAVNPRLIQFALKYSF